MPLGNSVRNNVCSASRKAAGGVRRQVAGAPLDTGAWGDGNAVVWKSRGEPYEYPPAIAPRPAVGDGASRAIAVGLPIVLRSFNLETSAPREKPGPA